jgi:hypothetical protein
MFRILSRRRAAVSKGRTERDSQRRNRVARTRAREGPMINELEFSADTGPSLRHAWARLASQAVRMRSDLVVVALDLALVASAFLLMLLLRYDGTILADG